MIKFFLILTLGLTLMAEDIQYQQIIYIKSSKEKVWAALTEADTINKYYMCPILTMGKSEGEKISFGFKDQVFIEGKILKLKTNQIFSHSFKFIESHPEAKNDSSSIVTYEIIEEHGLLRLNLTHSGFKERNATYANITGGWPYILSNLKTYLETGKTLKE
jgi:uncharacterized protein YndB with AHSA1/START domain